MNNLNLTVNGNAVLRPPAPCQLARCATVWSGGNASRSTTR